MKPSRARQSWMRRARKAWRGEGWKIVRTCCGRVYVIRNGWAVISRCRGERHTDGPDTIWKIP